MSPHVLARLAKPAPAGAGNLVLTRHDAQSIMIGDDIEIVVLAVLGNAVKLGIAAPRTVKVLRSEILGADRVA